MKLTFEAVHKWNDCDIKQVRFLKNEHRHKFYITAKKEVSHNDRDIEIITFKNQIYDYLVSMYYDEEIYNKIIIFTSKYGQLKPILIDKNNKIVDGNYMWKALKRLNYEEVECIRLNCSERDIDIARVCLSHLNLDIDNLKLASVISRLVNNKLQAIQLNGFVNITVEDIVRFMKLNEVDWLKELRQAEFEQKQQMNLFE